MFFAALFFTQQKQEKTAVESEIFDIFDMQNVVNKKNNSEELTQREKEYLEKTILDKLEEKINEINKKTKEEKRLSGYTQEELNFIANPRRTVEEELGIIQEPKKVNFYTQEELDNMANPK